MVRSICLSATIAMFCFGLGIAHVEAATTRWVNIDETVPIPPGNGCEHAGYKTIQAAVSAAGSGDTIRVCPGTYSEQVTIPAGKNSLTLHSVSHWHAIIKAPVLMVDVKAIVRVSASQNVTIRGFEISGPGSGGCDSIRYGLRVDNGGAANIIGNHIVDIRDLPPPPTVSGCQNGVAILVGRNAEGTTGWALIDGNVIERYQKNGPTVDNAGSFASITHNVIQGVGPTPTIAQNGIQVSRGANAVVEHNWIADNTYTLAPASGGTGVLLFEAGNNVRVAHTTSVRSDDNFGLYTATTATMDYDKGEESTFFDGIFVDSNSTNNQITHGHFLNNALFDCEDSSTGPGTGGTANYWTQNHGETESPPGSGICTDSSGSSSAAIAAEAGWTPNLDWTSSYPWAVEYDWSLAQSTISQLTTLPGFPGPIGRGGLRGQLGSYR